MKKTARFLLVLHSDISRGDEHSLKYRRIHLNRRKKTFLLRGWFNTQNTWWTGVSILGDTHNPSGHNTGQLAVGEQFWNWGWRGRLKYTMFRDPFQPSPFSDNALEFLLNPVKICCFEVPLSGIFHQIRQGNGC